MTAWTIIKLELGRTNEFPDGSASRAYLLRLPLRDDGMIDEEARADDPRRAMVRRFWPQEPDRSGYLIRKGDGWAFSYAIGEDDDEDIYHLQDHVFVKDAYITLTEAGGEQMPFRVASLAEE